MFLLFSLTLGPAGLITSLRLGPRHPLFPAQNGPGHTPRPLALLPKHCRRSRPLLPTRSGPWLAPALQARVTPAEASWCQRSVSGDVTSQQAKHVAWVFLLA